jgi:hypothetical protein
MRLKKIFYLRLSTVLFCFLILQSAYTQTEFKKMVDASAKTLPYDDYTISVSQFVTDRKNKNLVNELYQNGNQEQKRFYDKYLKVYDSQQLVSEFKVLIYMAANDDYKLDRLRTWDENLKYWGNAINKSKE